MTATFPTPPDGSVTPAKLAGSPDVDVDQGIAWDGSAWVPVDLAAVAPDAVSSVNGQTGVVALSAADVGAQPSDADLAAIAALSTTSFGRGLLALADAAAGRTALGLGSAATSDSSAFQAADSDLTAIAALTTTSYGRAFLALADAAAARTALALGTAATAATGDFQAADADLTAIAALTTTTFGRSLLTQADAAAVRTAIGAAASGGSVAPIPPFTAIAGGAQKTPSQLTMRAVHAERSRNPIPLDGPHAVFREEFMNADSLSARYTVFTAPTYAAPTSETIDKGKLTMVGSGATNSSRVYRTHTKLLVGTGVFCAVRVEPGTTPTTGGTISQAMPGFSQDSAAGGGIFVWYEPSDGKVGIYYNGGGGTVVSVGASGIAVPELVNPTKAVWIACILDAPYVIALWSLDGENWQEVNTVTFSAPNMYTASVWSSFRPMVQLLTATGGTIAISKIVAGYVGAYGYRDQKPITYADGTPIRRNGKYWFTATVAHGTASFRTNSMAIYSFDPDTYRVELVRHLYFNLSGTGIGSGYGGQIVYDETAGVWHILGNSWGFDNEATGVDVIYGTTSKDLLTFGSSLIPATRITNLGSNSYYDTTLRYSGGTWYVGLIETASRTSWAGGTQKVALYTGSALTSLTKITTDATNIGYDGVNWAKIGGTWYLIAGGPTTFRAWAADMSSSTALTSWSSDTKVAALLPFGGFPAHPCVFAVDDEFQTRYCAVTYDLSYVPSSSLNASRGGLVVLEADEKPVGQEHASKVNSYFGY